jgi:hypothetical protein
MDVFEGSVDLTSGPSRLQDQLHDYSPPIPASGLFWTVPVSPERVEVDFGNGTASFRLSDYPIRDWGNARYATTSAPSVPARVSFHVRWGGLIDRGPREHKEQGWAGDYIQTDATITWSASEEGFTFKSEESTSQWGVLGRQRSGSFYKA